MAAFSFLALWTDPAASTGMLPLIPYRRWIDGRVEAVLAFHQPAANQRRGNDLRWTAEEGMGQGWEILGDGLAGYGNGFCWAFASVLTDAAG